MTRLDDPDLVANEYADESRLAARRRAWREFLDGPDSDAWTYDAIAEGTPNRIVEVGCGWGELAERCARELGADVAAFDRSPRMAELARARGVSAFVADAEAIPVRDGWADVAVANAVLYHVPDLDRAIGEIGRVLGPGARLVATTFDAGRFPELHELVGTQPIPIPFRADNGEAILRRRFANVEVRLGHHALVFPNADEVRTYLRATITMAGLADAVPPFEGPLRTERTFAVFVATDPW